VPFVILGAGKRELDARSPANVPKATTMNAASSGATQVPAIEASSPAMIAVMGTLARVAVHDAPVLFRGESGSGKSTLARVLHAMSLRRTRPLVDIDCLLLQADPSSSGPTVMAKLEEAFGGTVLLEEVGAATVRLQAAALSLLDQAQLGDDARSIRLLATSHLDLEAAVRAGQFPEDLLARLGVVEILVPPLRDRREDILPLARFFLELFTHGTGPRMAIVTPRAQRTLVANAWPGNIRELRKAMQRAAIFSKGDVLDLDALPPRLSVPGVY
jgi:NtrC-family two-component system response regulator AlgB